MGKCPVRNKEHQYYRDNQKCRIIEATQEIYRKQWLHWYTMKNNKYLRGGIYNLKKNIQ